MPLGMVFIEGDATKKGAGVSIENQQEHGEGG